MVLPDVTAWFRMTNKKHGTVVVWFYFHHLCCVYLCAFYRYLQECGFVHAAYTFSHESMLLVGGTSSSSSSSLGINASTTSAPGGLAAGGTSSNSLVSASSTRPPLPNHQTSAQQSQPQSHQQNNNHRTSWQRVADKTLPPGALISFLQKGLQYVGIEESLLLQQQQDAGGGKKQTTSRTTTPNDDSNSSPLHMSPSTDFSLLCPASIQALTRRNPPIQLTVPPAAAAAAVKARLELESGDNAAAFIAVPSSSSSHRPATSSGVPRARTPTAGLDADPRLAIEVQGQKKIPKPHRNFAASSTTQSDPPPAAASVYHRDDSGSVKEESNNKRPGTSGGVKRSAKKQKLVDSLLTGGNASFTSLEQAMAQLEASKHIKVATSASSSSLPENDVSSNLENLSALAAQHVAASSTTAGAMPYLVNGELGDYRLGLTNGNVKQHDEHGVRREQESTRNASRIGSCSSVAENEDDLDDDEEDENDGERMPSPLSDDVDEDPLAAKPDEVLKLDKHQSEVFMCAWNPVFTNLIATGSGDASARIWEMNDMYAKSGLKKCIELPHGIDAGDRKNKDVTTLEWSTDGLLLATGSYDGIARVWFRTGALIHTLRGHQGPIFSLKWNRKGSFLLSGSYDKSIIVWNLTGPHQSDGGSIDGGDAKSNGYIEHQFKDHEAPALDVDWKNNTTFASCSTDRTVHIYDVDVEAPLKVYKGHMDEVNAVKWSPSGKYLASCSDDCTAKVWDVDSDRTDPLYDFVNHDQEIYTVKWSPTGPGSPNPSKMPLLATASFDGSIRLWNINDGSCFGYFNQHRDSVYSVAFSPSGEYLASGSLAGQMYIWDVVKAKHVKSYKGKGDIFEVAWNKEETRVAACFSTNVVAIIDFDRSKLPVLEDRAPETLLPVEGTEQSIPPPPGTTESERIGINDENVSPTN